MKDTYDMNSSPTKEGGKFGRIRDRVTVEPILLFFGMGFVLLIPTQQALVYRKVCLAHYTPHICNNLHNETLFEEENTVQSESAYWLLVQNVCVNGPMLILCFFYGSLSDNVSRKLALIIPIIGQMLCVTVYLIQSVYFELSPRYLIFGWLLSGLSGGWSTSSMASFSYMSDITTEKRRRFRLAVGEALIQVGIGVALLGSGILLDCTSFPFVMSVSLGIQTLLLIYAVFWIRDLPKLNSARPTSRRATCKLLCSFQSVKETFGYVFKKRKQRGRIHLILCFIILITTDMGSFVLLKLLYLYLVKQPLSWSQTLFGIYTCYSLAIAVFGTVFIMPLMQKKLFMRETTVLACSLLSLAAGMTLISFSTRTWMIFACPVLAVIGFCSNPLLRSLMSKMVEKAEYGRMFAMFASVETICGILSHTLYTNVYANTLEFWPGLSFALGASILLIPIGLTLVLRYGLQKFQWEKAGQATESNSLSVKELEVLQKEPMDSKTAMLDKSAEI